MKKVLILVLCLVLVLVMMGCGNSEANEVKPSRHYSICVDEDTGVNYIFYKAGYGGGLSPRYNADGTLYVSEVE